MISETYREIEIVLLEEENKWRFTANGRERTAPTLPKAREYIDSALDAVREKKTKKWEPFMALHAGRFGSDTFRKVRVTSEADGKDYNRETQFWIVGPQTDYRGRTEDKREKASVSELFALTDENEQLVNQAKELQSQADGLEQQAKEILKSITPIRVPSE